MDTENRAKKIKALADWLANHDDIAVVTHIMPDGDALGSALALMHALHDMGKRAFVCDQHAVPDYLSLLPASDTVVTPDTLPFAPKAVIAVDCADEGRMGTAGALIAESMPCAVIDHHETNKTTVLPALVDGEASASGVLVLDVLKEMGAVITHDIALCLYVAIATDTGNFSFSNTTPEAFAAAGECLAAGLDLAEVTYRLFRMKSAGRTRLLGRALDNMEYLADGRLALIRLHLKDFDECGANSSDTEGIVNFGIDTAGVQAAVLATEKKDGVKFSLRSREGINVAQAVSTLGGGGHARAAGVMIVGATMDDAIERVLSVLMPLL